MITSLGMRIRVRVERLRATIVVLMMRLAVEVHGRVRGQRRERAGSMDRHGIATWRDGEMGSLYHHNWTWLCRHFNCDGGLGRAGKKKITHRLLFTIYQTAEMRQSIATLSPTHYQSIFRHFCESHITLVLVVAERTIQRKPIPL